MIAHIKDAVLNIAGITGGLIATAGGAAQTLPLPSEIVAAAPGAETSIHGLMTLVLVAMLKSMPSKADASVIAEGLANHESKQEETFKSLHDKLDVMVTQRTEERIGLAEWTGGVTTTLKHHGDLIQGLDAKVDTLRTRVA